jgi:hypothetical protein
VRFNGAARQTLFQGSRWAVGALALLMLTAVPVLAISHLGLGLASDRGDGDQAALVAEGPRNLGTPTPPPQAGKGRNLSQKEVALLANWKYTTVITPQDQFNLDQMNLRNAENQVAILAFFLGLNTGDFTLFWSVLIDFSFVNNVFQSGNPHGSTSS